MFANVIAFLNLKSMLQLRVINKDTCRVIEYTDTFIKCYSIVLATVQNDVLPLSPNDDPDPEGQAVLREVQEQEAELERRARSRSREQARRKRSKQRKYKKRIGIYGRTLPPPSKGLSLPS